MELFYTKRASAIAFLATAVSSHVLLDSIPADIYMGMLGSIYAGRIALGIDIINDEKSMLPKKEERRIKLEASIERKL